MITDELFHPRLDVLPPPHRLSDMTKNRLAAAARQVDPTRLPDIAR